MDDRDWSLELEHVAECLLNTSDAGDVEYMGERLLAAARARMGVACPTCRGLGTRSYGSTATWHGGLGGCMITDGICDTCWGTGRTDKIGTDLRKLREELREKSVESSRKWFDTAIGSDLTRMRERYLAIATKLRKARWKNGYWEKQAADRIATVLEVLAGKE